MSTPLELPFDQYQRYRLVSDLLGVVRPSAARPLEILDVGGRTALLRPFLSADRVTLVDLEPSEEPGLVLGSGAALPFQDGSFDVVCAFDTLEHVPPALRQAFVAECHRVARAHVVLAGPYRSERVDEAELLLARFLREKLGIRHRYLEEHRAHGLPVRAEVEQQLAALGARTASIGHANIDRWLALMSVGMYMDEDPALRGLARDVHRFYNASLYASDHQEPVYRHAVVAALGDARLPRADQVLGRDPGPPASASLPAFAKLGQELMAFDKERGAWRSEREAWDETVRDLRADLSAHEETLAALRAEESAARRAAEQQRHTLERDLGEHRATLAELEKDRAAVRARAAELEAELARAASAHGEVRAALSADLEGHRAALAELRAERQALAAELAAVLADRQAVLADREAVLADREAVRSALTGELEAHQDQVAQVERELASRANELAELRAALAAREERIAAMQRVLDDRWKLLKRAVVGPKPGEPGRV